MQRSILSLVLVTMCLVGFTVLFTVPGECTETDSGRSASDPSPRIGLVLSGGGARGFAHIATMKMLDSLQVKVDCIAGTSMGGIMGALYAVGYSGAEIEQMVLGTDWLGLFSDEPPRDGLPFVRRRESGRYPIEFELLGLRPRPPSALIFGQNLEMFFADLVFPVAGVRDFDDLPIPFRCVAINLIDGGHVVLGERSLARAMRATMAIPTLFSPVAWGDSLLIDGGTANNLPVDVARQMGADFIIAVDVAKQRTREELNSALAVLGQWLTTADWEHRQLHQHDIDLLIQPDVSDFTMADFSSAQARRIIRMGEIAAEQARPQLLTMLKRQGYRPGSHAEMETDRPATCSPGLSDPEERVLRSLHFRGNHRFPTEFLVRQLGLETGDTLTARTMHQCIERLYGLGYFEYVNYDLQYTDDYAADVQINLKELSPRKLRVGLRYDDMHKLVGTLGVQVTNCGLSGLRYEGDLEFIGLARFAGKVFYPSRSLGFPVQPLLRIDSSDVPTDLYGSDGLVAVRYNDRSTAFAAGFDLIPVKWMHLELTYRQEYTNSEISAGPHPTHAYLETEDELHQFRAILEIDTLDDAILPRSGIHLRARYEEGSDDLGSDRAYRIAEASLDAYRTSGNHTLRCRLYSGRTSDAPVYKYLDQGRPDRFLGLEYHQLFGSRISIVRLDYRRRLTELVHLKLVANMAPRFTSRLAAEEIEADRVWGYGLGVKINSLIGPFEIIASHGRLDIGGSQNKQYHLQFIFGTRF